MQFESPIKIKYVEWNLLWAFGSVKVEETKIFSYNTD